MSETMVFVRQHSEATLLAAATALVAPNVETVVVHLVPDASVPDARARVVVDATVRALAERGITGHGMVIAADRVPVADRIRRLIEESTPGLLVLGARRLGRVGAMLQGSVTQQVLNRCSTMALVVPEDATAFDPPLHRILVAVGGDDDIERLEVAGSRLAAGAEYLLVHVARRVALHTAGTEGLYVEVGETSDPELDLVAHALERTGRRVRRSLLPVAHTPAAAIAELARLSNAELVVVGSNRPGPFRTLTATSMSRDLLVRVALPVLFAPVP